MTDFFMPHGHCYLWQPAMVALQVITNVAIGVAYVAISSMLAWLIYGIRDLPFKRIYACFGIFIVSCGLTHFMEVVTIWYPLYWIDGVMRAVTALASVGTAIIMSTLLPRAVALAKGARAARFRGIALETAVKDLASLLEATQRTRDILQQENQTYSSDVETLALAVGTRRRELQEAVHQARTAQLQAEKANRYKDEFLDMVSHELRTPLTALDLQLNRLLRQRQGYAVEAADLLQQMQVSTNRLERIIESLLQHTRLKRGELVRRDVACHLDALLVEVVAESSALGRAQGITLHVQTGSTGPLTLNVDPHILRLVLDNLLSNAIKFSPRGGVVVLSTASAHNNVTIAVTDHGPGISADAQALIFEPFVHLEAVVNKHIPGVGLGLALVNDMVRVLGGHLDLESRLGAGSTFRVTLPRRA